MLVIRVPQVHLPKHPASRQPTLTSPALVSTRLSHVCGCVILAIIWTVTSVRRVPITRGVLREQGMSVRLTA